MLNVEAIYRRFFVRPHAGLSDGNYKAIPTLEQDDEHDKTPQLNALAQLDYGSP